MSARRISAALLGLMIIVALTVRIALNMDANNWGIGDALWAIVRYFTIWTNTLIAGLALIVAMGRFVDQRIPAGLLLAIAAVGLVYHALLSGLNDYHGIDAVIDNVFHTVGPIWFALHWLALEPKNRLRLGDVPLWLAYPAIYSAYALIRAQFDGTYPYPFFDIADKGIGTVFVNLAGLLVAFALGGALIVMISRFAPRGRELA